MKLVIVTKWLANPKGDLIHFLELFWICCSLSKWRSHAHQIVIHPPHNDVDYWTWNNYHILSMWSNLFYTHAFCIHFWSHTQPHTTHYIGSILRPLTKLGTPILRGVWLIAYEHAFLLSNIKKTKIFCNQHVNAFSLF